MWVSLADENLVDYYKKSALSYRSEKAPELIILLLERLSKKSYADKLFVVTSVGRLSLTTALCWDGKTRNYGVGIDQIIDAGKPVLAISGLTMSRKESVAGRYCSLEEAVEYIDLYVMRILLEKYGKL
jgi:hypothetical protein